MRFFCLGCDLQKSELGFFKQKICGTCSKELSNNNPIYKNIVSKNNLWSGKILAVGPYSGIYRNLLFHAKVNRNPFAVKIISYWAQKKLRPALSKQILTEYTAVKQSLWSVLTIRPNIASMLQSKTLNHKKALNWPDLRKQRIIKRSFTKKRNNMVFQDGVQWSSLNQASHVIFDDVLSTGKTIDDVVCKLRDFAPKLIVTWACHPRFSQEYRSDYKL